MVAELLVRRWVVGLNSTKSQLASVHAFLSTSFLSGCKDYDVVLAFLSLRFTGLWGQFLYESRGSIAYGNKLFTVGWIGALGSSSRCLSPSTDNPSDHLGLLRICGVSGVSSSIVTLRGSCAGYVASFTRSSRKFIHLGIVSQIANGSFVFGWFCLLRFGVLLRECLFGIFWCYFKTHLLAQTTVVVSKFTSYGERKSGLAVLDGSYCSVVLSQAWVDSYSVLWGVRFWLCCSVLFCTSIPTIVSCSYLINFDFMCLVGARVCVGLPQYEELWELLYDWSVLRTWRYCSLFQVTSYGVLSSFLRHNRTYQLQTRPRTTRGSFKGSVSQVIVDTRQRYWSEYFSVKKVRLILPFWLYTVAAISELQRFSTLRSGVVFSARRCLDAYWYTGWFLRVWFKVHKSIDIASDWGARLRGQRAGAPHLGIPAGSIYYGSIAGFMGFGVAPGLEKRTHLVRQRYLNLPNNFCVNVVLTSKNLFSPYKWSSWVPGSSAILSASARFLGAGLFVRRYFGWFRCFRLVSFVGIRMRFGTQFFAPLVRTILYIPPSIAVVFGLRQFNLKRLRIAFSGVVGGCTGRVLLQNGLASANLLFSGFANSVAQSFFQ